MSKITVIGSIVYDHLYTFKGAEIKAWGGIFYNLIGFANILDRSSKIYPVTKVGEPDLKKIQKVFRQFGNIDISGITISPQGTNEDITHYITAERRTEVTKIRITPVGYEEVAACLDVDAILFNFTSGADISLETVKEIREHTNATVFMDVHNKVFAVDNSGKRYPKYWENWSEWLSNTDIVQMNEEECSIMMGRKLNNINDFIEASLQIMHNGPTQVLITLGDKGVVLVYFAGGDYYYVLIPRISVNVMDTTGSGDSFSSGYITEIIKNQNPVLAAAFATAVAGTNCEFNGFMKIKDKNIFKKRMFSEFSEIIKKVNEGWKGIKI
jgi:sugar/nucleoside kinase (ribokinase family)